MNRRDSFDLLGTLMWEEWDVLPWWTPDDLNIRQFVKKGLLFNWLTDMSPRERAAPFSQPAL